MLPTRRQSLSDPLSFLFHPHLPQFYFTIAACFCACISAHSSLFFFFFNMVNNSNGVSLELIIPYYPKTTHNLLYSGISSVLSIRNESI